MTTHLQDVRSFTDAERMELNGLIKLAAECVSQFWPMRTFIHHNPLHGLEAAGFHEAIRIGQQLFGARGYLSPELFRQYLDTGRMTVEHLDEALRPIVEQKEIRLAGRVVSHQEVLRAVLLQGCPSRGAKAEAELCRILQEPCALGMLLDRLRPLHGPWSSTITVAEDVAVARRTTLSAWCDTVLGTRLVEWINERLMHWCAAFLDEGQATWPLPNRELGFYEAWRHLAQHDLTPRVLGIAHWRQTLRALPSRPEDSLLQTLEILRLPKKDWSEYLSLHLAALPGWTGFIKWRAEQHGYTWNQAYPADLVQYLAVRLVYEWEFVKAACCSLGIVPTRTGMVQYMQTRTEEYRLRRQYFAAELPSGVARRVGRLLRRWRRVDPQGWEALAARHGNDVESWRARQALVECACRLTGVARSLGTEGAALLQMDATDLADLVHWVQGFPESEHGRYWLAALEQGFQDRTLKALGGAEIRVGSASRPRVMAQAVFCIDVRSERLRRHLEAVGGHETFGFAGFFGVPMRVQAFGTHHETAQCPVLIKPKHLVREIPRAYKAGLVDRYRLGTELAHAGHTLLEELKENAITPYVMVEAIGWLFALPFFGKTLFPVLYGRISDRLVQWLGPPISTTLTVDKLAREEAHEMLLAEQRARVRKALRQLLGFRPAELSAELVEQVRLLALQESGGSAASLISRGVDQTQVDGFLDELRTSYRLHPHDTFRRLEIITQTGFTTAEQARSVDAALRLMGLTRSFARLVLFCGHGSQSENNPYEAALDCGACGGNQGAVNARVLAAMANRPAVRAMLSERGLVIPPDTHFCAGYHDTTRDEITLFDLEDVPPTHGKDILRLSGDLAEAARLTAQERSAHFPEVGRVLPVSQAVRHVTRRSLDWSQVRPEWGLSQNAAIVIGPRALTQRLNLQGRVFLHSYDPEQDADGRLLETILTAPLVVAQWINMEHYFSTVDNEVYGSGSKIYHNVTARVGVMYGTQSDLRTGLPQQTVLQGEAPYHEPVRLIAVVQAPRTRVTTLIKRNTILQRLFDGQWVHLVVLDSHGGTVYRYRADCQWESCEGQL